MCLKIITLVVVLGVACFGAVQAARDCETVGIQCNGENTRIQMCYKVGGDPTLVKDCGKEDKVCLKKEDGTVVCTEGQAGSTVNFECLSDGEFPDPMNCKVSYRCENANKKPTKKCTCTGQNLFTLPVPGMPCVTSDKCPRKPIKCDKEGQNGDFISFDGTAFKYKYYCMSKPKFSSFNSEGKDSPKFDQTEKNCVDVP